jgi:Protein of unknown function (DUF998)
MPPVRPLLACGIAAPSLSLASDILACARWRGYSPVRQSISELSAVGAPTRSLVTALDLVRDGLLVAFAAGVSGSAGANRALRATGTLVLANCAIHAFAAAFLPRDYSEPTWSPGNTANTVVMATSVGCSIAAMATGAVALPGPFRAVSAGIPSSFAGLTALALLVPWPEGAPPTSTGAQERTMAYAYHLWLAGLAIVLLRSR